MVPAHVRRALWMGLGVQPEAPDQGRIMTPHAYMQARGIDTSWTALHRNRAHVDLAAAREAAWHADWCFEDVARYLLDGGPFAERMASYYLDSAFRWLESARASRRNAKESAL